MSALRRYVDDVLVTWMVNPDHIIGVCILPVHNEETGEFSRDAWNGHMVLTDHSRITLLDRDLDRLYQRIAAGDPRAEGEG